MIKPEKKLMTHVILNYPNEKTADLVVDTLVKAGCKFIELQIPFSDPIADGTTISQACTISLQNGFKIQTAFTKAKFYFNKYKNSDVKFIFILYANTINSMGIEKFCEQSKRAGIFGLIIPDLPFDSTEGQKVLLECQKQNLCLIPVVSPNTPRKRLLQLKNVGEFPYIYATSIAGITGSQKNKLNKSFINYIKLLREVFPKSLLALGFGIKTAADVKEIKSLVDIVVVGSAIVNLITNFSKNPVKLKKELGRFIAGLIN